RAGPGEEKGALRFFLSDRRGFPVGSRARDASLRGHRAGFRSPGDARDRRRAGRGRALGAGRLGCEGRPRASVPHHVNRMSLSPCGRLPGGSNFQSGPFEIKDMRRVLAIYLDGYEQSLGQRLMSAGDMPEMRRLAASSARFLLDHGSAQRSGLAGEHVATGLSPEAARRWSAVHFDPRTYEVWQEGTRLRPFPADLECRTVVFDATYFDLNAAPTVS